MSHAMIRRSVITPREDGSFLVVLLITEATSLPLTITREAALELCADLLLNLDGDLEAVCHRMLSRGGKVPGASFRDPHRPPGQSD